MVLKNIRRAFFIIISLSVCLSLFSLLSACGDINDNDKTREINDDETVYIYYGQERFQQPTRSPSLNPLFIDNNESYQTLMSIFIWRVNPIAIWNGHYQDIPSQNWGIPTQIKDITKIQSSYKVTYVSDPTEDGIVVDKWFYYWTLYTKNTFNDVETVNGIMNNCLTKEDSLQKRGFLNSYKGIIPSYNQVINFMHNNYSFINEQDIIGDYASDTIKAKSTIDYHDIWIESTYKFEFYLLGGVLGASALDLYNYVDFETFQYVDTYINMFNYDSLTQKTNYLKNKKIVGYYTSDVDDLLLEPVNADRSNSGTSAYDRIIDYYLHPVIYVL